MKPHAAQPLPPIRTITLDQPLKWLLLAWRGRTREQVLAPLTDRVSGAPARNGMDDEGDPTGAVAPWWPLTPGATHGVDAGGATSDDGDAPDPLALLSAEAPEQPAAVLARLDELTAEVRGTPVADLVAEAYPPIVDGR